jgi:uncharacterized protein (DUF433 family)
MTAVTISHIVLDDRGRAFVEGTRTRVAMIVMDKINGLSPEQIHASYPYLSISRIYAALAYYYDHQAELDAEIARESREITALRDQAIATAGQPAQAELQRRLDSHGNRA